MTNFLLVHGPWHDGSMWDGVAKHLNDARDTLDVGQVITVDLPGHGARRSFNVNRITTEYYVNAAVTPVRVGLLENVTLVAHSFAAILAPLVAARLGEALSRVILIAGMTPEEGTVPFKTLPMIARKTTGTFRPGEKGLKPPNSFLEKGLYSDVGKVEAAIRVGRLVPEPYQPWITPAPAQRYPVGAPVTYVALTGDRFLSPRTQAAYASSIPGARVVELPGGHMTPVVRPESVASLLLEGVSARKAEAVAEAS